MIRGQDERTFPAPALPQQRGQVVAQAERPLFNDISWVRLPDDERTFLFPGKAVWINSAGENKKPVSFGFQFDRRQGRFLKLAAARMIATTIACPWARCEERSSRADCTRVRTGVHCGRSRGARGT